MRHNDALFMDFHVKFYQLHDFVNN